MHEPRPTAYSRRQLLAGGLAGVASLVTLDDDRRVGADRFQDVLRSADEAVSEGVVPGYVLTVSLRGKVLLRHAAGTYYRLRNPHAPLMPYVLHPLYSFSKLISATVIAMAVADGLVAWDEPVTRWIPEFAGGGKDRITLRHLLTHSAGIPNPPGLGPARTRAEWQANVAAVCRAQTEWEPGSRTAYHGLSGQLVAAEAVLRASRESDWDAYCRKRLFQPLRAPSLTFLPPPDSKPVAIVPQPAAMPATHHDAFGLAGHPAGGCFGAPLDALKVLHLHLQGGRWNGRQLLPENALRDVHTVQYADAIQVARRAGREPAHEPWGLGPLLRGTGPAAPSLGWFGFANQSSSGLFGHAGIHTVIGIGDMVSGVALFFATTNSPRPPERTVPLRNGITDRVFAALAPGN